MITMSPQQNAGGNYVTSYDTGNKPFKHDSTRGKWSSEWDFSLACISHAFGLANFSLLPVFIVMHGGVFFIVPYTISLLLFTLPIFFIQSFLGQFSSTGFISVYRISPLFKGIGYVILILNIVAASVNSVTASYTLTYFFASFSVDLPWMSCNHTWNTENCSEVFQNITGTRSDFYDISWSTSEYFESKILNIDIKELYNGNHENSLKMAWPIFGSSIVIWIIVGLILYKGMEFIMKFIRYSVITIFSILMILFLRFLCFPDSLNVIGHFFTPTLKSVLHIESWIGSPLICISIFGNGWGTVLTMASFNNFKTNITKYSIIISFALLGAGIIASGIVTLADVYLTEHLNFDNLYYTHHPLTFLFIGFPYLFGNMEASHMWSLMFYLMLTLCELDGLIILMHTILTSLFDEYEYLRIYKKELSIGLPVILFFFSIIFTTNHGYELDSIVTILCGTTQMEICLIELIIVVWIYGRERFQRDLKFMLDKIFETWKFYLVRFITPLFILFVLLISMFISGVEVSHMDFDIIIILITMKFLPWICIPGYIAIKLISASGSIKQRLKRCIRPNDWYPVDPNNRQGYEVALGNTEISHQLVVTMTEIDDE